MQFGPKVDLWTVKHRHLCRSSTHINISRSAREIYHSESYHTNSRGLREISHSKIYHCEFDLARNPPPPLYMPWVMQT